MLVVPHKNYYETLSLHIHFCDNFPCYWNTMIFIMSKAIGILSFAIIHMSCLTYFCKKIICSIRNIKFCLTLQANMRRSLACSVPSFYSYFLPFVCRLPFLISISIFQQFQLEGGWKTLGNLSIPRLKDSKYKCVVTFLSP